MIQGQDFLIRYGLHSFVTYHPKGSSPSFSIKTSETTKMVRHAQKIIREAYGDKTDIRLN